MFTIMTTFFADPSAGGLSFGYVTNEDGVIILNEDGTPVTTEQENKMRILVSMFLCFFIYGTAYGAPLTAGKIPKAMSGSKIGDSIISESGASVTVDGVIS